MGNQAGDSLSLSQYLGGWQFDEVECPRPVPLHNGGRSITGGKDCTGLPVPAQDQHAPGKALHLLIASKRICTICKFPLSHQDQTEM